MLNLTSKLGAELDSLATRPAQDSQDTVAADLGGDDDPFGDPFEDLDAVVEDELLQLALALAKQVVRRELRQDPTQVIAIVREAISGGELDSART